jgi:hypothetical protein
VSARRGDPDGWIYGGAPLRVGRQIVLDTPEISWPCNIVDMRPAAPAAKDR